jgi:hypothetical protein
MVLSEIAGKNVTDAVEILKKYPGIETVDIHISWSLWKQKLPSNANKIKITLK